MALVSSLLTAIVRVDGDALVMHVGEKPYVVTHTGNVELSSQGLNLEAMSGMLAQLLPPDAMRSLAEFGAVEHELLPRQAMHGDRFTVVAARGGEDIWIELRRHRVPRAADLPPAPNLEPRAIEGLGPAPVPPPRPAAPPPVAAPPVAVVPPVPKPTAIEPSAPPVVTEPPARAPAVVNPARAEIKQSPDAPLPASRSEPEPVAPLPSLAPPPLAPPATRSVPEHAASDVRPSALDPDAAGSATPTQPGAKDAPLAEAARSETRPVESGPVLVPMTRSIRIDSAPRATSARPGGVERLLAVAAARGASVLCLTSQSKPFLRSDGEIHVIDGEQPLAAADVEAAVLELTPEDARDALRRGEATEWVSEFEGIGRIRCTTFRDYRGPGALFHLISAKPISADQLGLSKTVQALASEANGLVLIAAPRGGGKSTLIAALVDVINRQHAEFVVTLERQIRIVHENRHSLISQREVRGTPAEVAAAGRAALRENPDVLVLEDAGSAEVIQLALDAAESGLLVFVSVTAPSTNSAILRVLDWFPPDRRATIQSALAESLRGAVAQVMLRKTGGGWVAARELLLTTPAVASVLAQGQIAQLGVAMDSGRKHGMVPLNDALVALVQSGAVDVREAYRKADHQDALLNLLKREGVDTSFVERLA